MLRKADVCVENFAPGAIERLGLGYDVVKALNPSIIYAQVKGFGEGSPYEKNLAFDMIAQACGGTFSVTGDPDGPPTRPGISLGDTGTGMLMAITILGALFKRRETGEGRRLQVAMQDAIMHYMRINFATQGLTGKPAQRGGTKVVGVNNAPMGLYPCAPGGPNDYVYIMTSRANPDHWDRLLKLIGREDLIGDKRYVTPADRVAREPEVDEIIAAWTRHHAPSTTRCRRSARPAFRRARCSTRWNCRTMRPSNSAASCRPCTTRCIASSRCRAGRCGSTASRRH